jgi:hypothetical protein
LKLGGANPIFKIYNHDLCDEALVEGFRSVVGTWCGHMIQKFLSTNKSNVIMIIIFLYIACYMINIFYNIIMHYYVTVRHLLL